jgi:hypothetical protein
MHEDLAREGRGLGNEGRDDGRAPTRYHGAVCRKYYAGEVHPAHLALVLCIVALGEAEVGVEGGIVLHRAGSDECAHIAPDTLKSARTFVCSLSGASAPARPMK